MLQGEKMKDNELFKPLLGEGEIVLKTYRPHKLRTFFNQIVYWIILSILIVPGVVVLSTIEGGGFDYIIMSIYLVIYAVLIAISFLLTGLWLNKTIFAVTNKRVLIRTGRIGVDYKSLDFNMLGAITVNVSWVDKLLHKNTGSIAFGSMSSPLVSSGVAKFSFDFVNKPYDVYKEVKAIIDTTKNNEIEKEK